VFKKRREYSRIFSSFWALFSKKCKRGMCLRKEGNIQEYSPLFGHFFLKSAVMT
jgi:hypothetical protein